jgi:Sulfotransferase domain
MLPNFVVIGPPRCGTTWLHYNLKKHPEVFVPNAGEVHFFDTDFDKSLAHYESFFDAWSGQKAVGEITPSYLSGAYSANARIPEMMRDCLPRAKLIAVLRNPVERAYSHYLHNVAQDACNLRLTFEEKLEQRPQILREGLYADHLTRYLELFDRRQMLILLYDDLQANVFAFLRRIYEFLEVDPSFVSGIEGLRRNSAHGRGYLGRSRFIWHAARAAAKVGFVGLGERLRQANSRDWPAMSAETRRRLVELYRPSNERLSRLIDRDLSHWNEA